MAGSLYLGSQKVCPAIFVGGSSEPELTYFKFPDNIVTVSSNQQFKDFCGYGKPYYGWDVDVDFNNIQRVTGNEAFYSAFANLNGNVLKIKNIVSVTGQQAFRATFSYSSFENVDIDFGKIEDLSGYYCMLNCFTNSTGLPEVIRFTNLTDISGGGTFYMCFWGTEITDIYFNSLTTQSFGGNLDNFDYMLFFVDGCTLHFPSNLSSFVPTLNGYPNFGGTNTTIIYDLPATE